MDFPAKATLFVRDKELQLRGVTGGAIVASHDAELIGYEGPAAVEVKDENFNWHGEFQTRVSQGDDCLYFTFTGPDDELHRVASVLKWQLGAQQNYADGFKDHVEHKRISRPHLRSAFRLLALGAMASVLVLAIHAINIQKSSSIDATLAYVAFPGTELQTTTSGRLAYIADGDEISTGQFYAAFKTPAGYNKFLEAVSSGVITSASTGLNDFFRKGETLVRLSAADARPFLSAYVQLDEVVFALSAPDIEVTFASSGKKITLPGAQGEYANDPQLVSDESGNLLSEITISIPEELEIPAGEPVDISFKRPFWSEFKVVPFSGIFQSIQRVLTGRGDIEA